MASLTVDVGFRQTIVIDDTTRACATVVGPWSSVAATIKAWADGDPVYVDVTGAGLAFAQKLKELGVDVHGWRREPAKV